MAISGNTKKITVEQANTLMQGMATKSDARFQHQETGKGLSQENYTTTEKSKLSGIEEGANLFFVDRFSAASLIFSDLPYMGPAIDRFLARRLRGDNPDKKELDRCVAALQRRGHSWEDIRKALRRYEDLLGEEILDS